jgi:thiamine-monophosphate kinase
MSLTVESVGERGLIARLRCRAGTPPDWVALGIGDDAAVIQPKRGSVDVVTTDSLVEGVHFRREWSKPQAIGHKALAVNLSDLAAMAATPRAALLSIALPLSLSLGDFDELVEGFASLAERERLPLVGGNLTRSPAPLVVDVTLIGTAHPRRILRRDTARAGDALYVTGSLGAAATGLFHLRDGTPRSGLDADGMACINRYDRPEPRLTCGVQVGRNRAASACVDLSDGLVDAARQIADASGLGVVVDAAALPVHPGARAFAAAAGLDATRIALSGGEDYELLFAVGPRQLRAFHAVTARCGDLCVTKIGRMTRETGCWLAIEDRLEPLGEGFSHF